jgi:hypothetical protein
VRPELLDIPYIISIVCPRCGADVEWVIDDPDDSPMLESTGCPGTGCSVIHQGNVRHVDDDEAEPKRTELDMWS